MHTRRHTEKALRDAYKGIQKNTQRRIEKHIHKAIQKAINAHAQRHTATLAQPARHRRRQLQCSIAAAEGTKARNKTRFLYLRPLTVTRALPSHLSTQSQQTGGGLSRE